MGYTVMSLRSELVYQQLPPGFCVVDLHYHGPHDERAL